MKLKSHGRYDYSAITERKDYSWPGGKRLAVHFCLNVEHFSFGEGLGNEPSQLYCENLIDQFDEKPGSRARAKYAATSRRCRQAPYQAASQISPHADDYGFRVNARQ